METELAALDALGPSGRYRARNRVTIPDVAGNSLAELSIVPKLYVNRSMTALREAPAMPHAERIAALGRASQIFLQDTVDGLSFAEYARAASGASGVPVSIVRSAAAEIADAANKAEFSARQAQPGGAVADWRDPLTRNGRAVWVRRGDVLAVHSPGNHPGPHALWLEALALGFRIAVRPSRREPFTPHRMVAALRAAGFGEDRVVLLPTGYEASDEILRGADLGMVYGGDTVVRKYSADTSVLPQGPGRSKILITADTDWRDHLDTIVDSISHHGGVACINATAVLVEGDPAPLAKAIAERLAALPSLPFDDERAVLPVQDLATAGAVEQNMRKNAAGSTPWLGGDGIVDELSGGGAVLRPAVHQFDEPDADRINVELPFPCVWVAPWSRADGTAPLRNSLVLGALTDDEMLTDRLLDEPTISNVYGGDHPTYWIEPGVPHDGYLGEFLMRSKTHVRD